MNGEITRDSPLFLLKVKFAELFVFVMGYTFSFSAKFSSGEDCQTVKLVVATKKKKDKFLRLGRFKLPLVSYGLSSG